MAKKKSARKTSRKKATTRKASSTPSRGRTAKKSQTRKTTARPARRTTGKKTTGKTPARKKVTSKKVTARTKKKTAPKKTKKKTAAASKTRPSKKKAAPARTAKSDTGKTTKKTTKKTTTTKTKTAAETTSRKKRSGGRGRSLGARSVAEAASAGQADAQGYVYINGRRVRMISAGGQSPTRRARTSSRAVAPETAPAESPKVIKTTLTAKELRHYRNLLLEKRAELVGDVSAMETAALKDRGGNLSNLPLHMADIGTDTYDQDFMLSLAETERKRLLEIDDALARIQDKTYGVCQMTGKPIPSARLNAKPWAKYTIEAARQIEGQWRA